MFGKKGIPNPMIEEISQIFGKDIIDVVRAHSSSFVKLRPNEWIALAKQSRSIVFKEDEGGNYPYLYFIIGPGGVSYFTEIDKKVRVE